MATVCPDIAKDWHSTKNGKLTPMMFSRKGKFRWWSCPHHHSYRATPNKRTYYNQGCPICSKHQVSDLNRLSLLKPEIAAMWHPTKNGRLTPDDVSIYSDKVVWFLVRKKP